jgi:hypothetical protein
VQTHGSVDVEAPRGTEHHLVPGGSAAVGMRRGIRAPAEVRLRLHNAPREPASVGKEVHESAPEQARGDLQTGTGEEIPRQTRQSSAGR